MPPSKRQIDNLTRASGKHMPPCPETERSRLAAVEVQLLDAFAGMAMQAFINRPTMEDEDDDVIAEAAYNMASEMIAARRELAAHLLHCMGEHH